MTVITQNQTGVKTSIGNMILNQVSGPTFPTFFSDTTPREVAGASIAWRLFAESTPDFSIPVDGRLTYTGLVTKTFLVTARFQTGAAGIGGVEIRKNGIAITNALSSWDFNYSLGLFNVPVTLSTGNYVSIFFARNSGSGTNNTIAQLSAISLE